MALKMLKVGINYLAIKNIVKKPARSVGLMLLVALLCFSLLTGSLLTIGLGRGINTLANRLGADVMAVPAGHEAKIASVLLQGSPNPFYLPNGARAELADVDGIAQITAQTYVGQQMTPYYSQPVQMIGFEAADDFLISAWLDQPRDYQLSDQQCIVGSALNVSIGQTVNLYGKDYQVVARLAETGMAFDATVFVARSAARQIIDQSPQKTQITPQNDELVSTLLIKLQPGYQSEEVARQINRQHASDGIFGMFSKKFVNNLSSNLLFILGIIKTAIGLIWLLVIVVLALVFTMILRERSKEFATLGILGANRRQLNQLALNEAVLVSLGGALVGAAASYLVLFLYGVKIANRFSIPFLLPGGIALFAWGLGAVMLCLAATALASLYALYQLKKRDIYRQFRETE